MSRRVLAIAVAWIVLAGTATRADAHWFLNNHPKARKLAKIAGIGVLTGGVGAAVMGGSVAGGAVMGAGTHVGAHELKEKWKERKQKQHKAQ